MREGLLQISGNPTNRELAAFDIIRLMTRTFLLAVLILFASTVTAQTNSPRSVPTTEAISHVIQRVDPKTPAIATVAKVGGTVKVHIVISTSGEVASAAAVSGTPLLLQAAIDAVKQWKFSPFLDGKTPVTVATDIEFDFSGGSPENESAVNQKYYNAEDGCRSAMQATKFVEAEAKCREAVEISDQLPKDAVLERSGALSLLANDILSQQRFADSIPFYEKALEIDQRYRKADDADLASEYENLGRAFALAGDFSRADQLYALAVSTFKLAIKNLPSMTENYARRLQRALNEYAQIKDAEQQKDAASDLRRQATEVRP
jgi:TonB family protein